MALPNPALTAASFAVAVVVGLTGMGGGALMTPILMFFFGIPPLAAVGSDLVVSAVTKPFGALVHLRNSTADLRIAGWMCVGSVPSAFSGVFLARLLGRGAGLQQVVAEATGVVLIVAAAAIGLKAVTDARLRTGQAQGARRATQALPDGRRAQTLPGTQTLPDRPGAQAPPNGSGTQAPANGSGTQAPADGPSTREGVRKSPQSFPVRRLFTILVGILTGLGVGMTSVGSGSLVIVALTVLYPWLPVRRMVGTDLAQAVPMILAAATAHLIVGDVRFDVTAALLAGGIPGVVIGSVLSSRARSSTLRPILAVILLASGLKLVNVPLAAIAWALVVASAAVTAAAVLTRRRPGVPAFAAARARADAERRESRPARQRSR